MARTLRTSLPVALFLAMSAVNGQNSVDIAVLPGQNEDIEVRIRFENDFDGYFAASVFTIRWSAASGANLGSLQQDPEVQEYHDVNASGPEQTNNGFRYQIYAGFGGLVLSDIPLTLLGGEWITLCRIPVVNGVADFSIVNDDHTAVINGDFFISLGGQESQGEIIDLGTGIEDRAVENGLFDICPAIGSGPFVVEADLGGAEYTAISIMTAAGQEVWTVPLEGLRGELRRSLDPVALEPGVYLVRLIASDGPRVRRFVKN